MPAFKRFISIPHTAELAFRVYGKTLPRLFENAAAALLSLWFKRLPRVAPRSPRQRVRVEGLDPENLLVNWLNRLIFLLSARRRVPLGAKVIALSENSLTAELHPRTLSSLRISPLREVKSATYHNLKIIRKGSRYQTDLIFDV